MAKPQAEEGHFRVANEIAEALAKVYLSSYESRVLWALLRKTWGWHKKEDIISMGQFSEMTDIPRSHISKTLKRLVNRNIITKKNSGNNIIYGLQKNYEIWEQGVTQISNTQVLPKQVAPKQVKVLPIQDLSVTDSGLKVLPKQVATKDIKDTSQKIDRSDLKKPNPQIKEFIDFAFQKMKDLSGTSLIIKKTNEPPLIKHLLGTIKLDRLKLLWEYFITEDFENDEWLEKAGKTITSFNTKINMLNQNYDKWKTKEKEKIYKPPESPKVTEEQIKNNRKRVKELIRSL